MISHVSTCSVGVSFKLDKMKYDVKNSLLIKVTDVQSIRRRSDDWLAQWGDTGRGRQTVDRQGRQGVWRTGWSTYWLGTHTNAMSIITVGSFCVNLRLVYLEQEVFVKPQLFCSTRSLVRVTDRR